MVVKWLPNSRHGGDAQGSELDDVRGSEVIHVRSDPAAIVQLVEVIRSLVVSADNDGKIWCFACATVVSMEIAHFAVMLGHCHNIQVSSITTRL